MIAYKSSNSPAWSLDMINRIGSLQEVSIKYKEMRMSFDKKFARCRQPPAVYMVSHYYSAADYWSKPFQTPVKNLGKN